MSQLPLSPSKVQISTPLCQHRKHVPVLPTSVSCPVPARVKHLQQCAPRYTEKLHASSDNANGQSPKVSFLFTILLSLCSKLLLQLSSLTLPKCFLHFHPRSAHPYLLFLPAPHFASQHQNPTALGPFWEATSCRMLASSMSCQRCFQVATKPVFLLYLGFFIELSFFT